MRNLTKRHPSKQPTKDYKVHSLERGLDILEIIARGPQEMALTEVARQSEFSLPTTHRILAALKSRGYVVQNPDSLKYRPTFRLFELGCLVMRKMTVAEEALPVMRRLSAETGECSFLNIVDHDECLCLAKVEGHRAMQVVFLQPGGRIPLHIAAGPKVLLAHLPDDEINRILQGSVRQPMTESTITDRELLWEQIREIRRKGYALSFGEKTEGAASIACPILTAHGALVAGVSITGYALHFGPDKMPLLVEAVRQAARDISRCLGFLPGGGPS